MRLLLQRVSEARVESDGAVLGSIGQGLLVLAGFGDGDDAGLPARPIWRTMLDKAVDLRVFPDDAGRLNVSLRDTGGGLLVVSQFTLYADCRKGRRPSFSRAAAPETARALYDRLVDDLRQRAPGPFATGCFGADMRVSFTNWGPVTILLDSAEF